MKKEHRILIVIPVLFLLAIVVAYYLGTKTVPLYHFDNGGTVTIGCK